jgi:hypothetical protein
MGQDSSVNKVNDFGLDDRSSIPGRGRVISLRHRVQTGSGTTQSPFQCLSLVKWLEPEADHSSPPSAEVKNAWKFTSIPPYIFLGDA